MSDPPCGMRDVRKKGENDLMGWMDGFLGTDGTVITVPKSKHENLKSSLKRELKVDGLFHFDMAQLLEHL